MLRRRCLGVLQVQLPLMAADRWRNGVNNLETVFSQSLEQPAPIVNYRICGIDVVDKQTHLKVEEHRKCVSVKQKPCSSRNAFGGQNPSDFAEIVARLILV